LSREKDILESLASVDIFDQKEIQERRIKEWEGFREHRGLGYSFMKKFKIVIASLTLFFIFAGVYIYFRLPRFKYAYFTAVLFVGLFIAVYYWRKVVDQSME